MFWFCLIAVVILFAYKMHLEKSQDHMTMNFLLKEYWKSRGENSKFNEATKRFGEQNLPIHIPTLDEYDEEFTGKQLASRSLLTQEFILKTLASLTYSVQQLTAIFYAFVMIGLVGLAIYFWPF